MNRYLVLILLAVASSALQGCQTTKPGSPEAAAIAFEKAEEKKVTTVENVVESIPDWCDKPPVSDLALYACGDAESSVLNLARKKAELLAKADIASNLAGYLSEKVKLFQKEIGGGVEVETLIQQTIQSFTGEVQISGYKVLETKTLAIGSKYKHFLLIEYPLGEANQALVNKLKQNEIISTQANADAAFAELEAEINKRKAP